MLRTLNKLAEMILELKRIHGSVEIGMYENDGETWLVITIGAYKLTYTFPTDRGVECKPPICED